MANTKKVNITPHEGEEQARLRRPPGTYLKDNGIPSHPRYEEPAERRAARRLWLALSPCYAASIITIIICLRLLLKG